ncbi:uncharacterized protein DUF3857 [Dysgonomonas alginatilytica]|uniref:Uncharacterized protein DUF3857 n=1 Tax=Dysgonomonas alginatilytica TaxID=1605892 RepID=A0A2V3PV72_9BACT|nr:DUF3857 and transglutaminase domain-containing protein [Dysgonomonas alginatilytica]PXV68806.1 uncharacterized protein DUF3857 [Dysgonomonas alginatilytica]
MRLILTLSLLILFIHTALADETPSSEIINSVSHRQVKDGKLTVSDTLTIQINNRDGDDHAEILIPYSKGDKLSIGDAWIEDMSGNIIRKLKGKEILDRSFISNISLYEDDFVKEFELKHNQYPYKIVYSYKMTFNKFFQIASYDYRNKSRKIRNSTIIVETTEDQPIKYKQKNINNPKIETTAKTIRYIWQFSYDPLKGEVNASINNSKAPLLEIIPLHFTYGVSGSLENWQTFGNWVYRLNAGKDILPESETKKIDELLNGVKNDREKAKILYRYLQDYNRYINVKLNVGGLQTHSAEYVAINRYGDCKALTNYMQAILKYAGIKSYYTLINADDRVEDIDPDFASQAFNHVILTIPFGNDTTFLECTSNNLPFGYIHASIQNRKALLISEKNSRLITTPAQSPKDVLCNRNIITRLNTDNSARTEILITQRGVEYEAANYISTNINKNTVDKYIRNNILEGSFDLINFNFIKASRDSAKIQLQVECKMHSLYKKFGNNISITPYSLKIPYYENADKRIQDVQIDLPQYYEDSLVYEIPNATINKTPPNVQIITPYGHYLLQFEAKDNQFSVYKSILIKAGNYPLAEYGKFHEFIQQLRNLEIKNYYIEVL